MNPRVNRVNAALRGASALVAFVLASGLAIAGTAAPDATRSVATRIVSYSELNLSSAAGIATLYRRITGAAEEVCGPAERPGSRLPSLDYRECVARAVDEAVRAVHRPELSAYHAQKQGLPRLSDFIARR
jgi:UrcA family protein